MTSVNYKIMLDGGKETAVSESILIKIPAVKTLIEQIKKNDKITDKTTLNMNNINNSIFSHIITLVKFQSDKSDADILEFSNTIINNMDGNTLMDFILVTNKMELFHLKNLASARFLKIINNTNIDEIRTELKINNDFTATENKNVNDENEWLNE